MVEKTTTLRKKALTLNELHKTFERAVSENTTGLMSDRTSFAVPIIASPKISDVSWGQCKDYEYKKAA